MFQKSCSKCGMPATVQLNLEQYLCSEHAFQVIMTAEGARARKLTIRTVK